MARGPGSPRRLAGRRPEGAALEPGPDGRSSWSSAGGATAFAQLLDEDPAIDALFAASDQIALGALHVANARGSGSQSSSRSSGFDGLPRPRQYTPSLTTVRQPLADMGKLAVQELVAAVDAETGAYEPRAVQLPVELVIGDSAPLPSDPPVAAGTPARSKPARSSRGTGVTASRQS